MLNETNVNLILSFLGSRMNLIRALPLKYVRFLPKPPGVDFYTKDEWKVVLEKIGEEGEEWSRAFREQTRGMEILPPADKMVVCR